MRKTRRKRWDVTYVASEVETLTAEQAAAWLAERADDPVFQAAVTLGRAQIALMDAEVEAERRQKRMT